MLKSIKAWFIYFWTKHFGGRIGYLRGKYICHKYHTPVIEHLGGYGGRDVWGRRRKAYHEFYCPKCGLTWEETGDRGPTHLPAANEFLEKCQEEIISILERMPRPKTDVCGCGRKMEESGGFLYCHECNTHKVKNPMEAFKNVQQPFIPVYFGKAGELPKLSTHPCLGCGIQWREERLTATLDGRWICFLCGSEGEMPREEWERLTGKKAREYQDQSTEEGDG